MSDRPPEGGVTTAAMRSAIKASAIITGRGAPRMILQAPIYDQLLALLDRLEAAEAELRGWQSEAMMRRTEMSDLRAENARLTADLAALRGLHAPACDVTVNGLRAEVAALQRVVEAARVCTTTPYEDFEREAGVRSPGRKALVELARALAALTPSEEK